MTNLCGLCHQPRELRESHILPKAVYKLCRDAGAKNPNPVVTTKRSVVLSSHQVTAPFLCSGCEARSSDGGERYVLGHAARRDDQFRLRKLLRAAEPVERREQFSLYSIASLPNTAINHLTYFAASVFWRAAARTWKSGAQELRIDLGSKYEEAFRRYLVGEASFPAAARLFVHVWNDDRIHFMTVFPCSERVDSVWRHKFAIPGLTFILFVGNEAPTRMDGGAINSSASPAIWLSRWEADSLFRLSGEVMMSSPVKSPELLRDKLPQ
jgi:hypothetical protein